MGFGLRLLTMPDLLSHHYSSGLNPIWFGVVFLFEKKYAVSFLSFRPLAAAVFILKIGGPKTIKSLVNISSLLLLLQCRCRTFALSIPFLWVALWWKYLEDHRRSTRLFARHSLALTYQQGDKDLRDTKNCSIGVSGSAKSWLVKTLQTISLVTLFWWWWLSHSQAQYRQNGRTRPFR